jgi:hypothetical protein
MDLAYQSSTHQTIVPSDMVMVTICIGHLTTDQMLGTEGRSSVVTGARAVRWWGSRLGAVGRSERRLTALIRLVLR